MVEIRSDDRSTKSLRKTLGEGRMRRKGDKKSMRKKTIGKDCGFYDIPPREILCPGDPTHKSPGWKNVPNSLGGYLNTGGLNSNDILLRYVDPGNRG